MRPDLFTLSLTFLESYENLPNIRRAVQLGLVRLDRWRREEGRKASARWAFDPSRRQLQNKLSRLVGG
jgi:hypothetical protein